MMAALSGHFVHAQQRAYRLPDVDINQRVVWGSQLVLPDGTGLAFGGQDQDAADGRPHTRVLEDGKCVAIYDKLARNEEVEALSKSISLLTNNLKANSINLRRAYFRGESTRNGLTNAILQAQEKVELTLKRFDSVTVADSYDRLQLRRARHLVEGGYVSLEFEQLGSEQGRQVSDGRFMSVVVDLFEEANEWLGAEPPPRALSQLAFDKKTGLFVLFGGDHCDCLMNDTWVFDPKKPRWERRDLKQSPSPRANHKFVANGDGTITLTGGYTYASNTDYVGGQYIDIGDGPWTYDVVANKWSGKGDLEAYAFHAPVYRTGPFHPDFYFEGDPPKPKAVAKELSSLPSNTWVKRNPPRLPRLNRDWGTAVIDPDRDMMLRFSGGHSAHGGTDVLHYHFSTNRWELTFPVEFPLGQLYANTRYPAGLNFNLRPWVTGHTYRSYGYDVVSQKMLFTGRTRHTYFYDPSLGDWIGRQAKPKAMAYNSCFYTLTLCSTPHGLLCWTKDGKLLRYASKQSEWTPLELSGDKLRGTVVDRAGCSIDSSRNQLVCMAKTAYRGPYDGIVYRVDLATNKVKRLQPAGHAGMKDIGFLREQLYDPKNDLIVVGALLQADSDGVRRTPAYDLKHNRWIGLRIGGEHPHGKDGRNVSLGLMYDAKRKLHWAVDTNSQVYVLKLDAQAADPVPLN
jgi:hypothetical protein